MLPSLSVAEALICRLVPEVAVELLAGWLMDTLGATLVPQGVLTVTDTAVELPWPLQLSMALAV